jgi:hypothetical protein
VRLGDPDGGAAVGDALHGHNGPVAFGVGGDGRPRLASAGYDATVRLWDPATGAAIVALRRRTTLRALAARGTQLTIVDGGEEGMTVVELWMAPDRSAPSAGCCGAVQRLIAFLCARTNRLTYSQVGETKTSAFFRSSATC